jgi:VanZ family protein
MLRKLRWALLWAVAVLVLTLIPGNDVPTWGWAEAIHFDKLVHAGLFGIQTVLLGLALAAERKTRNPLLVAAILSILYGAGIELLQEVMEQGRHADAFDLLSDTAGAVMGYVLLRRRSVARP